MAAAPARGLHHVGVTVADLERSAAFYEDVFGGEREWLIEAEGDGVDQMTRVPGTSMRVTSLKLPYGALELFEFSSPEGRVNDRRLNDVGATHVCLEVDDVDAVYEKLGELGVECWYPPQESTEGPLKGLRFFYFQDPDGLMVEVLRPPQE
jgi:catechol 2,3-dioxygenase-like lactoylglutathione lyase family enzyme